MRIATLLGSLVLVTLGGGLAIAAEPCSEVIRQNALDHVRAETKKPASQFLRAIRLEDVEEELFGYQRKILGRIRKTVAVFEVTDTGWEIVSPFETELHSSTAPGKWTVAVGTQGGPAYGLRGFANAEANFNSFCGFAGIEILDRQQAYRWVGLYYRLVLSEHYGSVVTSSRDLRDQAESIEDAYRQSREPAFSASQWLKRISKGHIQYDIPIESSQRSYAVSLMLVGISDYPKRVPVLRKLRLILKQDGSFSNKVVQDLSVKPGTY